MRHVHQWGTKLWNAKKRRPYYYCINGWCPMAKWADNGRIFMARPERQTLPRSRLW